MQLKGRSRKAVLADLKKIRAKDSQYMDGRILCSMCTEPHPAAKAAHKLFLSANLGDAGLFPGTSQLEKEVIGNLATLLSNEKAVGFIVSGGTEANLLALLAARNRAGVSNPEVVLPQSAHFSFNKICSLLRIKPVQASLDSSFRVDPAAAKNCISKNTIAIIGTAGTTELGAVDPIGKLSEIAVAHGIHLHVDAALGGLMLPFMENAPICDFRLEGVASITVDPHKMGLATVPAGGILFRDSTYLEYIKTETPYLTENAQYTFVGTRSGASAAATWAVFETLGREGFTKTVNRVLKLTQFLSVRLKALGFELVTEPTLNIIAFRCSNSKLLARALQQRGWFVSYVPHLDCVRIVVMPHLKKLHITTFLQELTAHTKTHQK
ncbi:MAG: tyrosine decarboxylase MfnA [Candidatus Bathyarchaeota archaeon]|nr:tyrosine decarboxylase MfnA [Candidatus Bathyarchaeota archaeon]